MTDHFNSSNYTDLEKIFHPKSVAIVGVPSGSGQATMASGFLNSLLELKFQEIHSLYPVNPKMDEVEGLKCYKNLLEIDGEIDHVISMVPARVVPQLVEECVEKKVNSVHFYTAGFSETGDPEMVKKEKELITKLNDAGIRAIGPNCMGLYVPSERIGFMNGFPPESGNVFLLSQSGANAGDVVHGLAKRGVRFSKAVSFGNGADIKAHHLLNYAAQDSETEVVAAYMEGVQEGRDFFQALKKCAAVKPTVILKGGIHAAGARAANSHTGSLAGSIQIFEAACRQAGAMRAETMDDLHDLIITLTTNAKSIKDTGVALVSGGGGYAVLSSDAIATAGLDVPQMPAETVEQLREFIPVAGTSVNNPIDTNLSDKDLQIKMLEIVANSSVTNVVFTKAQFNSPRKNKEQETNSDKTESVRNESLDSANTIASLQNQTSVPFVAIQRNRSFGELAGIANDTFANQAYRNGIAVYPTVSRAARSLGLILNWRNRRKGLPEIF